MKVLIPLILFATAGVARADGWWKACDADQDPSNGTQAGCGGSSCEASGAGQAASVGTGLGLIGLVAYRLGRRRRPR